MSDGPGQADWDDADRRAGRRPFTAWGQWPPGSLDLRVFGQSTWWVDIEQRPHRIEEMSRAYRRNVLIHLQTHVAYFHVMAVREHVLTLLEEVLSGEAGGETLATILGAPSPADLTPSQWLEATPLVRHLRRALTEPDPTAPGDT